MKIGDFITKIVDNILNFFKLIKGFLEDALAYFEKIKNYILETLDFYKDHFEDEIDPDQVEALTVSDHYFI